MEYGLAARQADGLHGFERVDGEGGKSCAENVADTGRKLQAGGLQRRIFSVEDRAVTVERGEILRQI